MALTSTCAKCGGHYFEIKGFEPRGANYKQNFVQCTSCGVPVGVLDYYNVGTLLKEQEKDMEKLARRLAAVESALETIDHNVRVVAKAVSRR